MQLGMASALETLCGQAYGAKQNHMLGIYLQRSCILLVLDYINWHIYDLLLPIIYFGCFLGFSFIGLGMGVLLNPLLISLLVKPTFKPTSDPLLTPSFFLRRRESTTSVIPAQYF